MANILVTGAAGFIGMHVAERLLQRGDCVLGIDNMSGYYDPRLKEGRLVQLSRFPEFRFAGLDVADVRKLQVEVSGFGAEAIIHLAAQAGVRFSLERPFVYEHSNVAGHLAVLEVCRHAPHVRQLVYASSSSVYGSRPLDGALFSEDDPVDQPQSLYAATKRSCELMTYTYSRLYGLKASGLRLFTVYGPWGRPDMAYFKFTEKILRREPIEVFGEGKMTRDFTYIDDVVDGVIGVLDNPPPTAESRIFNVGGGRPTGLMEMISTLEQVLGCRAHLSFRPMQPGDVTATRANASRLHALTGNRPKVPLDAGLMQFANWYRSYYAHTHVGN